MDYIFFLGSGRSGTKFTGRFMKSIDNTLISEHEYIGNRNFSLLSYYLKNTNYSRIFLSKVKEEIESSFNGEVFSDSNGYLSFASKTLEEVFKPKKIYHLVRDPRMVVSSLLVRRDPARLQPMPNDDASLERWINSDILYQICWNWNNVTSHLIEHHYELLHFEKLISDYEYCREKILNPLGKQMTKEKWESIVNQKVNKTRGKMFRFLYSKIKQKHYENRELIPFEQWSDADQKVLIEVCGENMKKLGYL